MPNNKMERFTQRARRVLELAQQEAEQMRHAYIGTEHMLVALIVEEGGVAGRVLHDLEVELTRVRGLVIEHSSFSVRDAADKTPVELSPATKRALELAVDEARRMGHHYIGTEHLLLGLARQEDSTAFSILKRLGITGEAVRQQTRRVLQESPVQESTARRVIEERFSPAVRSAPPPLPARPPIVPQSYGLLQATIIKLLDMVGEGKLTLEQANELLQALQPDMQLTTGGKVALASRVNQSGEFDKQAVHIVVTDRTSQEQQFELVMSLSATLANLDKLLMAATDVQVAVVVFESETANMKVEVRLEKE